jgi:hypothetical protein
MTLSTALDGLSTPVANMHAHMPLIDLTEDELRNVFQASCAAAAQAQRDAGAQSNPRINAAFAAEAERYKR